MAAGVGEAGVVLGRQAEGPGEAQAAAAGIVRHATAVHCVACPGVLAGGTEAGVGCLAPLAHKGIAAAVTDTPELSPAGPSTSSPGTRQAAASGEPPIAGGPDPGSEHSWECRTPGGGCTAGWGQMPGEFYIM